MCWWSYLSGASDGVLLLDLDLADVAGVVDDLGDVCLVATADLTGNSLCQVRESTVHPVLPEDTDTVAEGGKVGLDHAEGAVDGPENEEDDEHVVRVPETLKVGTTRLLSSCDGNGHERKQHDITTPSGTGGEVGEDEAHEAQLVDGGKLGEVVPMGDGVDPGEEDDGPGNQLVEGDVLVKGNDVVERGATGHGN
jgi:hypothetical protein